jgi:hypothetical protein
MHKCTVTGCDRPTRSATADLCNAHYFRVRRTGSTGDSAIWDRAKRTCSVEGCNRRHDAEGLCFTHIRRLRKGGSVDYTREPLRGADNPSWKGGAIGYVTAHERIYRARGRATGYLCACGRRASHWAYRHDDPAALVDADGRPYSVDPAHYDAMCVPCHKRFDLARQ